MPDYLTAVNENLASHEEFHAHCLALVTEHKWINDEHYIVFVIREQSIQPRVMCPGDDDHDDDPRRGCHNTDRDNHPLPLDTCLVRASIGDVGYLEEFLRLGAIHVTVNGPVRIVWECNTGVNPFPILWVSPLAAVEYAAKVVAMEYGEDKVNLDWDWKNEDG